MAFATIDEVWRQKTPELKVIAQDLMVGTVKHVERAFDRLATLGSLREAGALTQYPHYIISSLLEVSATKIDIGFYWHRYTATQTLHIYVVHNDNIIIVKSAVYFPLVTLTVLFLPLGTHTGYYLLRGHGCTD